MIKSLVQGQSISVLILFSIVILRSERWKKTNEPKIGDEIQNFEKSKIDFFSNLEENQKSENDIP